MTEKTDALRAIFLDLAGEEPLVERQEEEPSREPVGEHEAELEERIRGIARRNGLDDAVADAEIAG